MAGRPSRIQGLGGADGIATSMFVSFQATFLRVASTSKLIHHLVQLHGGTIPVKTTPAQVGRSVAWVLTDEPNLSSSTDQS